MVSNFEKNLPRSGENIANITLGAFERFNYGDLLFPIILEYVYYSAARGKGSLLPLVHCTVGVGDMSAHGGVETRRVQHYLRNHECNVIVAGGEVIGAGWYGLWASLQPTRWDGVLRLGKKLLSRRIRDALARYALGGFWRYPFLPDVSTVRHLSFNAVGATHSRVLSADVQQYLWSIVSRGRATSLRDRASAELASSFGLEVNVVPDSAALLFDIPRFAAQRALAPVGGGSASGPVVVQMSLNWALSCSDATLASLDEIGRRSGGLTLLAVGLAGAHSDQIGLQQIGARLNCMSTLFVPITIDDIVSCIAGASVVIASSLHVNITAVAAGVPQIPLAGVAKLSAYMSTWGFDSESPVDGDDLLKAYEVLETQPATDKRVARAGRLSMLVRESIEKTVSDTYF